MNEGRIWLDWAMELQSIAQAGLTYGHDIYDRERYGRIREIAAEMLAHQAETPYEKVRELFCNEIGYQTPKLDTRAAIFQGEKILLVRENDGLWSLPGGWVEANLSVRESAVKEVREEAGLEVRAERLIAVQDRKKHNLPVYPWGVCKIFVLCAPLGGEFRANSETTTSGWFAEDALPPLATAKNNAEQIAMCFAAHRDPNWPPRFD